MNLETNIQLSAEEIARACESKTGTANRQAIEDAYERQTDPAVFVQAVARADRWPRCENQPQGVYGLQYAYLLQFLICDEIKRQKGENIS